MTTNNLNKTIGGVSKASDCREDAVMIFQGNANWEEYLTPAPLSIAFLGELVFISAKQDFSIKDGGPVDGFKFIKYPDSFRACLMQVCNSGWAAFNEAHKSMDKICLHTKNVPEYIKTAVKILLQDDDMLVQNFLPDTLESIDAISKDCVQLAKSVEERFLHVTDVISELLETCTSAKQQYGNRLEEVRRIMEEEKLKKDVLEEENKRVEKEMAKLDKQMEEANDNFQKAMTNIPSGWECIAMDFVDGMAKSVNSLLSLRVLKASEGGQQTIDALGNPTKSASNIFTKSPLLLKTAETLNSFIKYDEIQWSKITDIKTGQSNCKWLVNRIEEVINMIQDEDPSPEKKEVENLCEGFITICQHLEKLSTEGKKGKNKEIVKNIQQILLSTQKFDSASKKNTNAPAFPVNSPGMMKIQSGGSASQMATKNAHFCVEQMKIQLTQSRESYEKSLERNEKTKRKLTDCLIKMRNCEVKDINFETTIELLATGLQSMGRLQEKWRKMVQFFQMVSNIMDTCLKTSLNDFVKTASKPPPPNMKYSSKMFLKDMIYQQAFKASDIANMVNMISGTYTEISTLYLMDRVSSLGRLMTLDPEDPSFQRERNILATSCDNAAAEIQERVLENKEKYKAKTKARIEKIERELNAALPPPSEEERRETREIVAAGFEVAPEDEDQFY
ncbi:uncharacterized protein LOC124475968 [Hypomesus transpacificus]|uniref:uncharacterized protein LOC124475968 n=1 Tax=Hypomesus transpacificus TaxID=137520 RepID=UPI001F07997D|nr:uncharacterized protein LOC124475968 [Hypomesus transpacificus]XP_046888836.1 uncharacterized protein LOC124475968 [Hypomesus transpacificus]